ncbi:MAG: tRNA (N6-isopentenyl adenosine(37)-C2)-methylthiotransferase MiaB [Deltaproteobacteria bacterium]|nr:tRNA (N6-isopentenyl adenosine(37)-C2)-methylthiotransferase MiaB [Deltaproteobacteria bacterium]
MSRRVYIETFGCQMNEVDSARMLSLLEKVDYTTASSVAEADLVLLNTCSIREKADQKIYSALGRLRRWKRARHGRIVAVGGCLAQQEGAALTVRAPYVDIVFGTHNISRLPELVRKAENAIPSMETDFTENTAHWDVLPYLPEGASSAMVTIMQGCENYCAYCIVPYVRGKEISRPASGVLEDVRKLADRGVAEVVLLGQNVNSYGKREGEIGFSELVRRMSEVPGIERIRFITSHPRDLGADTIALFSEIEAVCPHLHLPVQSGSDRILADMGRGYTRNGYLKKIDALRRARPGLAFSSDFIVGFPGETEKDFEDTIDLMEEVRFDSAFSFRFSPRAGTRAASMPGAVPAETAGNRLRRLQQLQSRHTCEQLSECVGREMDVLVEGPSLKDETMLCGRTECYKMVNFSPMESRPGPIRRVRIRTAGAHSLSGVEGA